MKGDPAAACRFFSPEDACRFVLAAYYGACRDIEPPEGETWLSEGQPWSSPSLFVDAVHARFTAALNGAAIDARIPFATGLASAQIGWDDRGFPGSRADFLASELNGLPSPDNRPDNHGRRGLDNG